MLKILLMGGTGAMGNHLVSLLKRTDNQVVVTSRSKRADSGNISYIQGNAHELPFLHSLLKQKFDIIIDFMVYNTGEFKIRYKTILTACQQYIFISSSRVYADSHTPITEDSPRILDVCKDELYLKTDEYALTKARQENILFYSGFTNYYCCPIKLIKDKI